MTLYRCNKADDPRCPYMKGEFSCQHWHKHDQKVYRSGTSCGMWGRCSNKDEEFSVRCCRVETDDGDVKCQQK